MSRARTGLVALLLTLAVTGCVTESRPASCDAEETAIATTLTSTGMDPDDPAACIGQRVTMSVTPETDGVLHIHGLDSLVPATEISAGDDLTLEFTPDRSGQFPIELHIPGSSEGVTVAIFTVHER